MFKNSIQLYSVAVCFIATIVMMITTGLMLGYVTNLTLTEYKHKRHLNNFATNEKYVSYKQSANEQNENWQTLGSEIIENKRLADRKDYIETEKSDATSSLITCSSWLLTGFLFFIIHWRLYKHSSKND